MSWNSKNLELAVEEARDRANLEYTRLSTLDNRAVSVLTIVGLLLALLAISEIKYVWVPIIPLLVTVILSVFSLKMRAYHYASREYLGIAKKSEIKAQLTVIGTYACATGKNIKTNNKKSTYIQISYWVLALAMILTIIVMLIPYIGKLF